MAILAHSIAAQVSTESLSTVMCLFYKLTVTDFSAVCLTVTFPWPPVWTFAMDNPLGIAMSLFSIHRYLSLLYCIEMPATHYHVRVSMCWGHGQAVQKRRNRSRCRLRSRLMSLQILDGPDPPTGEGTFEGHVAARYDLFQDECTANGFSPYRGWQDAYS